MTFCWSAGVIALNWSSVIPSWLIISACRRCAGHVGVVHKLLRRTAEHLVESIKFVTSRVECSYLESIREKGNDERVPSFFFCQARRYDRAGRHTIGYPPLIKDRHHEVELIVVTKSALSTWR
jgi:2-keto-4-pentenoate hydratase/2-oxohepta-3-ene-1,7-dioic acid hydratase in catechol pathway